MNWERWLPPSGFALPDTGPKEFKVGQVIVGMLNTQPEILKIVGLDGENRFMTLYLAGYEDTIPSFHAGSRWARFTLIIQDVDQVEPTDPDILYQFLYMPRNSR